MISQFSPLKRVFFIGVLAGCLFWAVVNAQPKQIRQSRARPKAKPTTSESLSIRWHTFRGPDNDFTIGFPYKPKRVEDAEGPITVLRRYASATESTWFEISIQDFGGAPDSRAANEYESGFERQLSEGLRANGFRIVQLRRTAKNVYEMEAWVPVPTTEEYQHNLARGILRNGRQYRMGCNSIMLGKEVNKNLCRRFFDSFNFIKSSR